MNTILTVIGARPQIIKAAAISRAIRAGYSTRLNEVIVHTGQHYDQNMSGVFFEELGIPKPDYNLEVGSGDHGIQTAKMIEGLEKLMKSILPKAVLVYGDTNSTLAAAIAASKLWIPLVHVEAGLRSYNKRMPEEINRIVCDHCSSLLFSPTIQGIDNLRKEGFVESTLPPYTPDHPGVFHCGDVMLDNSLHFKDKANERSGLLKSMRLDEKEFILLTIHRDNNTDKPERLHSILRSLVHIANTLLIPLIWPVHPRTKNKLASSENAEMWSNVSEHPLIHIVDPLSFLDMTLLESKSRLILTDSGGVQKEAYFFKKPCVILRPQTEWVELIENGNALLADADENRITSSVFNLYEKDDFTWPAIFGDGMAAEFICEKISSWLETC